ncbi:MAG: hypothetical protein CFE44_27405, partial [Burkholderiales bacterium PBB4]
LVALDERIAYSAVAKHYADYGRDPALVSRDYLAKVFNVFVTLPNASKPSITNYVRSHLFTPIATSTGDGASPDGQGAAPGASGPPPTSRPAQDLQTSSALEVETFAELVDKWGLSNPRELWRLRQTWSLLKGVALGESASDTQVRIWMQHMFFREMFLQSNAEQRGKVEGFVRSLPDSNLPFSSDDVRVQLLAQGAGELSEGFQERDTRVMAVLLPAAPLDLPSRAK